MGTVKYTEQDFQKAAIQFKNDLLPIPFLSMKDSTKFMTVVTGVRYEQLIGTKATNARFKPAGKHKADSVDLNLNLRALKTYPGELTAEFDPNEAIQTLLGHKASQASGDGLKDVPSAKEVLALIAKQASEDYVYVIWKGKRDPKGNTAFDICDGLDTITAQEIEDGEISAKKKNLLVFDDEISEDNILEFTQKILDSMSPKLRKQDCFLFCSQRFADLYNRAYKADSKGLNYNDDYEQIYVEGSNKKLTLAPVEGKVGSEFIHICPKSNIKIGCDQESDLENVNVKEYSPRLLTFLMDNFLGTQFNSIHRSQMLVAKIKPLDTYEPDEDEDEDEDELNDLRPKPEGPPSLQEGEDGDDSNQ